MSLFDVFQYALAGVAGFGLVIFAFCVPDLVLSFKTFLENRAYAVNDIRKQVSVLRGKVYDLETKIGTSDKIRSLK